MHVALLHIDTNHGSQYYICSANFKRKFLPAKKSRMLPFAFFMFCGRAWRSRQAEKKKRHFGHFDEQTVHSLSLSSKRSLLGRMDKEGNKEKEKKQWKVRVPKWSL